MDNDRNDWTLSARIEMNIHVRLQTLASKQPPSHRVTVCAPPAPIQTNVPHRHRLQGTEESVCPSIALFKPGFGNGVLRELRRCKRSAYDGQRSERLVPLGSHGDEHSVPTVKPCTQAEAVYLDVCSCTLCPDPDQCSAPTSFAANGAKRTPKHSPTHISPLYRPVCPRCTPSDPSSPTYAMPNVPIITLSYKLFSFQKGISYS
jgi:hypothetical protein